MSDHEPPKFPDLSQPGNDSPTRPDSGGSIFSRPAEAISVASAVTHPSPRTSGPTTLSSPWRWAVVGLATVLVVGLLGAVFVLAQPRGGTPSTVARYAPANSTAFLELNEDLPGDQHNLLAQYMSHFPGFADQAAFDTKLDETLQSVFASSQSGISWREQIKPWFGGEMGIFGSTVTPSAGTPLSMTVALTVKTGQKQALQDWLTPMLGSGWQQSTYQGSTIWSGQFPESTEHVDLTWSDEALLVSSRPEDLWAALDVRADRSAGLADDQFFLQQLARLHADRLGLFYLDGRALASSLSNDLGAALPSTDVTALMTDAVAVRIMGEIRAEGDHLAVTTRTEHPVNADLPPLPSNRSSTLADQAPADALVYAEMRDVGQTISWILQRELTAQPSASGAPFDLSSLQTLLGSPPREFFDFITDASVSVSGTSANPDFGLIASVDDDTIAQSRVQKIVALLHTLTQFGAGVTFSNEQHGTTSLTVITVKATAPGATDISLAIALTPGRLLLGTHTFVVNALDRTHDQSLAARPAFQAALTAGGTANAGVAFVDIAALRGWFESRLDPAQADSYNVDSKPFLEPLSNLSIVNVVDNGTLVTHVFLYVK